MMQEGIFNIQLMKRLMVNCNHGFGNDHCHQEGGEVLTEG